MQLRSCLSSPLLADDRSIGVLSLYSVEPTAFSDDQRRLLEAVAPHIAQAFKRAIDFESSSHDDAIDRLPQFEQLTALIDPTNHNRLCTGDRHALLRIDVVDLNGITREYGPSVADEILRYVVVETRPGLRGADILFRNGAAGFVALLEGADSTTTEVVGNRIRDAIALVQVNVSGGRRIQVRTTVTAVASPQDGTLQDLLNVAKERTEPLTARDRSTVH